MAACAKHFLGYSATKGGLNLAEVNLTEHDILETFAYPFAAAIAECDVKSIMVTYSSINGVPASINKPLLRDLFRGRLGFQGNLLCDGGSIEMCVSHQHVCGTNAEAGIKAIQAGLDANTPVSEAYRYLPEAVEQGKIKLDLIDEAVERVLRLKFDSACSRIPLSRNTKSRLSSPTSASSMTPSRGSWRRKSLILLKNDGDLLPLDGRFKRIAAIGPQLDTLRAFYSAFTVPASVESTQELFKGSKKEKAEKSSMGGASDAVEKDLARKVQDEEPVYGLEPFFHEVAIDFALDRHRAVHPSALYFEHPAGRPAPGGREGIPDRVGPRLRLYPPQTGKSFAAALETAGRADAIVLPSATSPDGSPARPGKGATALPCASREYSRNCSRRSPRWGNRSCWCCSTASHTTCSGQASMSQAILDVWTSGPKAPRRLPGSFLARSILAASCP